MPLTQLSKRLEELDARLEIVTLALLCDGNAKRNVLMAERRGLMAEATRISKMLRRPVSVSESSDRSQKLELVSS